jgi:hypothetical protein
MCLRVTLIDLDSIRSTAKAISTNLRKIYTGDRPGDVPGNLPDPYYWWECGAMFNAFIDYWYDTVPILLDRIKKLMMQVLYWRRSV